MRLKVTTTVLLITGLLFLLAWPLVVGHRPPASAPAELKSYVIRFGTYVILLVCVWVSVAFSALFTIRRLRKDLTSERAENLRTLLEATSADHRKKDNDG